VTKFLIDTNSIVEAKDFFYAFDLCPGFWNSLRRHHESGEVFSIDRVKSELTEGNDILVRWAKMMPKSFFVPSGTADVATEYATIIQWVQANYQRQEAVSSFAAKADGWLIAYAKVHAFTIVSEEKQASKQGNADMATKTTTKTNRKAKPAAAAPTTKATKKTASVAKHSAKNSKRASKGNMGTPHF